MAGIPCTVRQGAWRRDGAAGPLFQRCGPRGSSRLARICRRRGGSVLVARRAAMLYCVQSAASRDDSARGHFPSLPCKERSHVLDPHEHRRFRSGAVGGDARRNPPPGRPHRTDRLRELRQPARAAGAGIGIDEQVCGRLSRQALLWRLRACGRGGAAGHRARLRVVRRRLGQRAAAFRLAGQRGGLPGPADARRHGGGHEPGAWRPPDARGQGEFLGQALPGRAIRREHRGPDRL